MRTTVVGGGIAGLAAATLLARGGAEVTVLERGKELGGRARTTHIGGVALNLGPHALYRGGPAWSVLAELGVKVAAGAPPAAGTLVRRDRLHALPTGLLSLLTSGAVPFGTKLDGLSALGALQRVDAGALRSTSVGEWLERTARSPEVRDLLRTLITLSTYSVDPRQSAGAALAQLGLALRHGVVYLDGGWEQLVHGLRDAALAAGARIETGAAVRAVEHDGQVRAVRTDDGRREVDAVVLAVPPAAVRELTGLELEVGRPVEVCCLDLALKKSDATVGFALALDRAMYFSVHSRVAKLGPPDVEVVHAAKYLGQGDPDDAVNLAEVEGFLDLLRPGWRQRVVERRVLPRMAAAQSFPTAEARRPGPAIPGVAGLFVAGDWVGDEGLLADAALASARQAARAVLAGRETAVAA